MYGLSRETVKPGAALLDLVNLLVAAGTFFKIDPERYAAEVKGIGPVAYADTTGTGYLPTAG